MLINKNNSINIIIYLVAICTQISFGQINMKNINIKETIGSEKEFPQKNDLFFHNITDLTLDSNNNLYVLDAGNQRIVKFDSTFNPQLKIGRFGEGPGEFGFKEGMINAGYLSVSHNGNLFVLDNINKRVQKFNEQGKFISSYKIPWTMNGIEIAGDGYQFLSGSSRSNDFLIHVFNEEGSYISSFSRKLIKNPTCNFFNDFCFAISENDGIYLIFKNYPIIRKYNNNYSMIWEKQIDISSLEETDRKIVDKIFTRNPSIKELENYRGNLKEMINKFGFMGPIINDCIMHNGSLYILVLPCYIMQLDGEGQLVDCYRFKIDSYFCMPRFLFKKENIIIVANDMMYLF